MPLLGGFGFLELCLYGKRELAWQHLNLKLHLGLNEYLDKYYALLVTLVVNILHRFQNFSRHRVSRFIWAEMV